MTPRDFQQAVLSGHEQVLIYRVNEEGETVGKKFTSYLEAYASNKAFCGFMRDGMAIYDIDHQEGVQASLRAVQELERHSIFPVVIESSRGTGRAHLYVPYDTEEERVFTEKLLKEWLPKCDNRTKSRIRPPFSPSAKPNGLPMALVYPKGEEDAYRRLKLGKGKRPRREELPPPPSKESKEFPLMTLELEREFKKPVEKGFRSEHLFRLGGICKGLGWSPYEFESACLFFRSGAGSKALRKPKGWLITQVWNKVQASKGGARSQEAKEYIARLKAWSVWAPPKQQSGAKTLIDAILEQVEATGKYEGFHLSYREASALMGTSNTGTAQRRITWLLEAGFLEVTKKGSLTMATEYRVCLPKESLNSYTPIHSLTLGSSQGVYECNRLVSSKEASLLRSYREAFHGLNTGYMVAWELLSQGKATAKALSERLNRKVSLIKKYLRALEFFELVQEVNGVWSLTLSEHKLEGMTRAREKVGLFARHRAGYERHKETRREYQVKTYRSRKHQRELQELMSRAGVRGRPRENEPSYAYAS